MCHPYLRSRPAPGWGRQMYGHQASRSQLRTGASGQQPSTIPSVQPINLRRKFNSHIEESNINLNHSGSHIARKDTITLVAIGVITDMATMMKITTITRAMEKFMAMTTTICMGDTLTSTRCMCLRSMSIRTTSLIRQSSITHQRPRHTRQPQSWSHRPPFSPSQHLQLLPSHSLRRM